MIEGEEVSPGAGQIHHGVGVQTLRQAQQRGAHTLALEAGGHCQGAWQRNNKPSPTIEGSTVGVNKNCTLVFVNFSAQDASILKISVPIIKRRS